MKNTMMDYSDRYREAFWANLSGKLSEKEVSWNEFARRLGVPSAAVFHAKAKRSSPRLDTVALYAKVLGLNVSELVDISI